MKIIRPHWEIKLIFFLPITSFMFTNVVLDAVLISEITLEIYLDFNDE